MSEKNRHGSPNGRAVRLDARFYAKGAAGARGARRQAPRWYAVSQWLLLTRLFLAFRRQFLAFKPDAVSIDEDFLEFFTR